MIARPDRVMYGSVLWNATTTTYDYGSINTAHSSDQPNTYLLLVHPDGAGENNSGYMFSKLSSASTDGFRILMSHNSGNPTITFGYGSTGTASSPSRTVNTGFATYGAWNWIAASHDGSLDASMMNVYHAIKDNRLAEVTYSATTNGTTAVITDASFSLHVGNRTGTDRTFNGSIALVARWNAKLTLEEIERAKQYGPLRVRRRSLLFLWANGNEYSKGLVPSTITAPALGRSVKFMLRAGSHPIWPIPTVSAGAQTIICTGIASAEVFGSHTITTGAVSITCTGIASAEAFGSHTIVPGAVTITCTGIASAEAFGSHVVVPGVVSIVCTGIASAEAFGDHIVSAGGSIISATGIASAEVFGSTVITTGAVSIVCTGIASGEAFGSHVVSSSGSFIVATGIASGEVFGSTSINVGGVTIVCSGIASAEAFGSTVVSGAGFVTIVTKSFVVLGKASHFHTLRQA